MSRDFFWDGPHPTAGSVRQLGSPIRLSGTVARRDRAGPLLGEDSAAVVAALGYGAKQIKDFEQRKVIRVPEPRD